MKIILKESVNHLGRSGDVVKVSPGYARNYLIPKGVALMATSENMKVLEAQQAEISAREAEKKKVAEEMQKVPTGPGDRPATDVVINSVAIQEAE